MRIALAQINSTVGDLAGNADRILAAAAKAASDGARILVTPEMALTGYPPEDLLLKPAFLSDTVAALRALARRLPVAALVGFAEEKSQLRYNAAAWIENGRVAAIYRKNILPNYGVFDEDRYFRPGDRPLVRSLGGLRIGVTICEDIWVAGRHWKDLRKARPDVVINLSASPFHAGKIETRHRTFRSFVRAAGAPLLYCNAVGGQDELVFDGGSFAVASSGRVCAQAPLFEEGVYALELERGKAPSGQWPPPAPLDSVDQIHAALVTGVRDYVRKNGFGKVAIGISGGIDSALVAALAAEALGPENVVGVTMPSKFNAKATVSDAERLGKNLGIPFFTIPIQDAIQAFGTALAPLFKKTGPNEAEENIQARIRGTLLMALSNKFGWLVLTTGNKSEMSTGYCTLYGDTAGGFAVIKDVLKTTVYALSRRINERAGRDIIPQSIIDRPPTAELRADQKDEDSLGPYSELDPLIVGYVEENRSLAELARARPGREDHVRKILAMIDRSEYKRRQAPPGIKITPRSFGRDHRMPITNRYRPA